MSQKSRLRGAGGQGHRSSTKQHRSVPHMFVLDICQRQWAVTVFNPCRCKCSAPRRIISALTPSAVFGTVPRLPLMASPAHSSATGSSAGGRPSTP